MASGDYQLIILDEIIGAVSQGQWDLAQVLDLVEKRPRELNSDRPATTTQKVFIDDVIAVADLATEMKKVKHPFDEGHQARQGLDY